MKDIKIAATQFEQLQNGCSLIIDTFGGIIAECQTQRDDITIANINPEKIEAGGTRYIKARRPDLYLNIKSGLAG